ncbi:SDR family oxidoreductase [Ancylobacter dichloromethanicus]|uniref:Oxidoreductase n=1 Tax=Ancylobacter dichloromethanicus TaxID=518825 RepID=A0A9W6J9R7_9HYPH|nr:SDR family oxidoreductase [Ancylobacter dichloromethanicus]MBS7554771.1 SDR family oxidoreductase [Ancylobacter dichloromethanicus]GLK72456.1 oxidoreductase [Ancylobacter dichloromethanicus]
MSTDLPRGTAVVTGASSGIGRVYAEKLARRGYDLLLVARDRNRLDTLAAAIAAATGRNAEVLAADLGQPDGVEAVAARIASDDAIILLVNNAGMGTEGPVVGADAGKVDAMVQLNVAALTRLSVAAVNAFSGRGRGTLVNIASVVALVPEAFLGAYAGTKAYVLAFTQSLQSELKGGPVRVQAVVPGYTMTEFFDRAGIDAKALAPETVMSAEDLVEAALRGLEAGETITIPSVPDMAAWQAVVDDRMSMAPVLSRRRPAARYGLEEVVTA